VSGRGGIDHPVVVAPLASRFFQIPEGVRLVDTGGMSEGVTFPRGFVAGGVVAGLKESGRPDVGVVAVSPEWRFTTTSAAVFTTNAFAAAPIVVDRERCALDRLMAVVMNSANANACTGEPGLEVARIMQRSCAEVLEVPAANVAVGSTGIIGVQLDAEFMSGAVAKAARTVGPGGGADFGRSILTTDRFPKMCAMEVDTTQGPMRLGVSAKGAGMIAPAMATMLCVATTDAALEATEMRTLLDGANARSFNRITVDGEMSTNDSVFFMASGASGIHPSGDDLRLVGDALDAMLLRVALMMVADGEGATKIMRLEVTGAEDAAQAARVARAIGDSALVKTAMHGADPNWGRIISSAGAAMAGRELPSASLHLCGIKVVEGGAAAIVAEFDRRRLGALMKEPEIDIEVDLGLGTSSAGLFFADLGHEYITINAEYHS